MKTSRSALRGMGWLGALCLFTLAASGQQIWSRVWGSVSNDYVDGVTVDSGNGIYVVGATYGSFDSQVKPDPVDEAAFLTKYTADGTKQWSRIWGPTNAFMAAMGVAVDTNLNIYAAGTTQGLWTGKPSSANGRRS